MIVVTVSEYLGSDKPIGPTQHPREWEAIKFNQGKRWSD